MHTTIIKGFFASAALAFGLGAHAVDITGAGATFPFPIYAKWAEAYKAEDRRGHELPVDRLGRRHQADPGQDRRLRRVRHAAQARRAGESRASRSFRRSSAVSCPS